MLSLPVEQGIASTNDERARTFLSPTRLRSWWSGRLFAAERTADGVSGLAAGILLALLAAFLFFSHLQYPLIDPDEGRHAEIPRVMLERNDWLVPSWRGKPYYEKPPLQYWLTATLYLVLGVSEQAARLVPTTAAWLTVLLTYLWGRRVLGTRAALISGLVLCLMPGFFVLGRLVLLDSVLTLCVVAGWYAASRALESTHLQWRWWLLSALVSGLGVLQKGPVIVILVSVPALAHSWLHARSARIGWRALAVFLGLAAAVALPWYVAMSLREPEYAATFLWKANVLRYVQAYDHRQPWWFYFPVLAAALFPWSLALPGALALLFTRDRRAALLRTPGLALVVLAALWCFAFYSLSTCKSPPYLLPALPPFALWLGATLDHVMFSEPSRLRGLLRSMRNALPASASLALLALSPLTFCMPMLVFGQPLPAWQPAALIVAGLLAMWCVVIRQATPAKTWGLLAFLMMFGLHIHATAMMRALAVYRSPVEMARTLRPLLTEPSRQIVLYDREWPSTHFYLQCQRLAHYDSSTHAFFCEHVRQTLVEERTTAEMFVLVSDTTDVQNVAARLPAELEASIRKAEHPREPSLLILRPKQEAFSSLAGPLPR